MFDYVIVGAGSAGCVLANRLSQDPSVTVCLIEAGGSDRDDLIDIPVLFGAQFKTSLDWDLSTDAEPQLYGQQMYLPRGKVLGGCSSMNAMIYIRGSHADFDEWERRGARGWSWQEVKPYFIKLEDNPLGPSEYHGAGGPLTVSPSRSNHPAADAFVDAAVAAGLGRNDDFNGATQDGFGRFQVTQRDGRRCSTAKAYLQPVEHRENLTVLTHARVTRIRFEGNRARGVDLEHAAMTSSINADREVIVAAGAYESPKLLMLSGIGRKEDLVVHGIDQRADLPVGHNLQDHLTTNLNYRSSGESLLAAGSPENRELFLTEGRGPLTSNVAESCGFVRTREGLEAPDVQIHHAPAIFYGGGLVASEVGMSLSPLVLRPTSTGRVTLRSARPDAKPRIVHNYLDTEEDRQTAIAGIRIALEIAGTDPLATLITEPYSAPAPDASDEELLEFARMNSQTLFHPTSTCAIGQVVDPELRVMGFEGLRVVDASVMPTITRGNTNAPTIMIAEKAADLILGASSGAVA